MKTKSMKKHESFSPQSSIPAEGGSTSMLDNEQDAVNCMSLLKSPVTVRSKFSDMFYNIYYYQIRGNKILKYSYSEFRSQKQIEMVENLNETKNETYKGEMSIKSASRLRKKIQIWYDGVQIHNDYYHCATSCNHRQFVFLTLTLSSSQIHTDRKIKLEILKPFIRILRDKYKIKNYIWKAESQANGNIHFHLLLDKYIDRYSVQKDWNKCQNALGYIDEFEKKYKHTNPPSTQVEAVRNYEGLSSYFEKYIAKTEAYRKIEGAVWKGSQSVMTLQFFEFVGDTSVEQSIIKAENEKELTRHDEDRYSVYSLVGKKADEILPDYIVNQHHMYNSLLDNFLFGDEIVFGFRDFCYLFSFSDYIPPSSEPFVCVENYPIPVQLTLWDIRDICRIKNITIL